MRTPLTAREAIDLAMADAEAPEPRLELRPRRPRAIRSAGGYVAVVRRLYRSPCPQCHAGPVRCGDAGVCWGTGYTVRGVADGRLIAPLWRGPAVPPREWGEDGRGQAWLAYWAATQPRPERVGSCYNDEPAHAARAWSLGIPAERYPRGQAHLLPPAWHGGQRRILTACRLARRRVPGVPAALRTAELRRLSRLSGAFLRAVGAMPTTGRGVDWAALAREHARWLEVQPHRAHLQAARVPVAEWLSWLEGDTEVRRDIEARHAERAKAAHAAHRRAQREIAAAARREREGLEPGDYAWRTVERHPDGMALQRARHYGVPAWRISAPACEPREWIGKGRPDTEAVDLAMTLLMNDRHAALVRALGERHRALESAWCALLDFARERERERAMAALEASVARRRARRAEDGALLGWRGWRVRTDRMVLLSPYRPVIWEGPELEAMSASTSGAVLGPAVIAGGARGQLAGDIRDAAGIHATWDPRRQEAGAYDPRQMDAIGRVRGYGAYAAGPEGWRAERVVIDRLLVPEWLRAAAPALAVRYQCRVRVVRGWGRD